MYPQKVTINSEHRYFHENGDEYIGFSKLYDNFMKEPFNVDLSAYGVAKSEGVTAQSVKDRWEEQRKEGVRIDDAIDYYSNTGLILPSNSDIADGVKEVLDVYSEYHKSHGQLVLYSEKYKVAGTCDRLSVISNRKDCPIIMSDFKCFEKEIEYMPKSKRFLNAPFNHFANTKYTKIAFQLSFYSYLFEGLTGRVPIRQFIHWIDPRSMKKDENGKLNLKHKLIDVPYLKNDVILFLEIYKEKILSLTHPLTVDGF